MAKKIRNLVEDGPELTERQQNFVRLYVLMNGNGVEAARAAGYSQNYRSAQVHAHRLLSNAIISTAISNRRAQLAARYEVTETRIIEELAAIAFFNPKEVFDLVGESGELKSWPNIPDRAAAAIARVSANESAAGRSKTILMYDKLSAIKCLVEYLGLFKGQSEQTRKEAMVAAVERLKLRFGIDQP